MKPAAKKNFANYPKPQPKSQSEYIKKEKEIRENHTEEEIDKTLKDSFPASDPPGGY